MLQRLGKDALVYGLATLLVRGIQIVLIPVYSRVLGASEYGIVETMAIVGALVNLTVALEISQGMARYMAEAPDKNLRRRYASTALVFGIAAYSMFVLFSAIVITPVSQWLLGDHGSVTIVLVAFGALAINGIFVLVQDLLRWELRPGAFLTSGLAYTLGSAGLGIFLVVFRDAGVIGIFWGQLAGALLGGIVAAGAASGLLIREFDGKRLLQMLGYSAPLVFSGFAVFANLFVDRIVVRQLLGIEALGLYGVAARFASVVSILTVGLQVALSPLVFRSWREPGTASSVAQVCRYYCAGMVPLIGGLGLFSGEIMLLASGPAFHDGRHVLPVLAIAAMFSTLYIFAPGLFLGERTGHVAALNVAAALLNLALALWLVPHYGMIAASAAAAVAAACGFAGFVFLGGRYFRVPYQCARVAASMLLSLALVLLALAWNNASPVWDLARAGLKLALLLAASAVAVMIGLAAEDRAFAARALGSFVNKLFKGSSGHGH